MVEPQSGRPRAAAPGVHRHRRPGGVASDQAGVRRRRRRQGRPHQEGRRRGGRRGARRDHRRRSRPATRSTFTGFGKFHATRRAARQGVNPRTGEPGADRRCERAEVLGRLAAEEGAELVLSREAGSPRSGIPPRGSPGPPAADAGQIPEGRGAAGALVGARRLRCQASGVRDGIPDASRGGVSRSLLRRLVSQDLRLCGRRCVAFARRRGMPSPLLAPVTRVVRPRARHLQSNICSNRHDLVQLSFDAADRLVELVQARRGPVAADEAAREAVRARERARRRSPARCSTTSSPADVAARLARRARRARRPARARRPLEDAHFVVLDLETTGLSPRTARICEIGAQRVRALELADAFETLVDPGMPIPAPRSPRSRGSRPATLRGAPRAELAVRRLPRVRGRRRARRAQRPVRPRLPRPRGRAADRPTGRRAGRGHRLARPTAARRPARGASSLALARALPRRPDRAVPPGAPRRPRDGGDPRPAARARPGARRADGRGPRRARRAACPAAPRQALARRGRADARPARTSSAARTGLPLYVGRARDLRARLRSYFAGGRQRPAVEAALAALERGRVARDRLGARGGARRAAPAARAAAARERARHAPRPSPLPAPARRPLERRERADAARAAPQGAAWPQAAARALDGHESDDVGAALPVLRGRLGALARAQRFEDAARLRDRLARARGRTGVARRARPGSLARGVPRRARPGAAASSARSRRGWPGRRPPLDPARCGRRCPRRPRSSPSARHRDDPLAAAGRRRAAARGRLPPPSSARARGGRARRRPPSPRRPG